jgi:beta-phosphoglucomutase-like phosphatase (HAD superfamily)
VQAVADLRARGVPIAVASSSVRERLDRTLAHAGLAFEVTIAGDEVEHGKPAPDIYLLAQETLRLPPNECMVIEDSRNGLLAATGAGFPTLITTSTYTVEEDFTGAARIVPELGDEPNVNVTLADLGELAAAAA